MDAVMDICQHHHVDMIIPTIDTELQLYADYRPILLDIGTDVLVSNPDFVTVARDKKLTVETLKQNGIATPGTWDLETAKSANPELPFPLFLKPIDGSCSAGIAVVDSLESVRKLDIKPLGYILQEMCQGKEYTINAFYTREGKCAACVPHYRKMVRAGEVCFAETVRVPEFQIVADKLGEIFPGIWGNICFQGFMDETGGIRIFEINARFGGGYPICDRAGGTFARWIMQDLGGQQPDYHDAWKEGVRMLRYDAAIFVQSG
jgi:carbamoyl-phosphate synthase large subunit